MDDLFMVLIIAGIAGFFYFRKKDKKKRNISIVIAIVSFVLFNIVSPDAKEEVKEKAELTQEETSKNDETKEQEETEKVDDNGNNNELPDELKDLRVTDVRGDTTGNWKKVVDSKNFNMPENAITYAEEYMKEDEVHYLISFATNTTTMINDLNGMLFVNITEYEKKEEHSADTIGGGMLLKSYNIYKDSGEIEEIEE